MYCTVQNIKDLVPAGLLAYLTGNNDNVIVKAIEGASSVVNAYISGAYDLSTVSSSVFLQSVAERVTIYNLYMNAACDETPEIVSRSYKEAIGELEKIQKGVISIATADSAQAERQGEVFSNKSSLDRVFSDNLFRSFDF